MPDTHLPPALSPVAETRKLMEDLYNPRILDLVPPETAIDEATPAVMVVPRGTELRPIKPLLDAFRTAPERRKGTAVLTDLASFIAHTVRFADTDSVIFANSDPQKPSLTSVLDYHRIGADGAPRFGQHRAVHRFPLSEPWSLWAQADGKVLTHREFAELIEDRIGDILLPPLSAETDEDAKLHEVVRGLGLTLAGPTRLLELSRGLKVNEESRVTCAHNLSTGEIQIQFETEHKDGAGAPLKVPNAFLVGMPVFENGAPYRVIMKLRYRLNGGKVVWIVQRHRPDLTFKHAFDEACQRVREETGLPLLMGSPEADAA